ncbi:MAG: hypothetical protein AB8G96_10415 [Phycisphaerales bacterium]
MTDPASNPFPDPGTGLPATDGMAREAAWLDAAAWLDDRMTPDEAAAFEAQMADDTDLRRLVASLRLQPITAEDAATAAPTEVVARAIAAMGDTGVASGTRVTTATTNEYETDATPGVHARPASIGLRRERSQPAAPSAHTPAHTPLRRIGPWLGSLAACLVAGFVGLRTGGIVGRPAAPPDAPEEVAAIDLEALDDASFGLFRDDDGGSMLLTAYIAEPAPATLSEPNP